MIEVIVSLTILSGMALLLSGILGTASNNWVRGEEMVEASQSGRTSLELIAREMASPIVGPRQQFQIMNGATLRGSVNAEIPQVPSSSMAAFWLAPLGTDGQLRRVGYYLERRDEEGFYRLKRLFTSPTGSSFVSSQQVAAGESELEESTCSVGGGGLLSDLEEPAFDDSDPENEDAVVSTVAEGVVGLWFQSLDSMDNEIPWVSESEVHPACESGGGMAFNSAAMFQMATSAPMELKDDPTFLYYRETESMTKGDRLPSAVEVTILTVDSIAIEQAKDRFPDLSLPTMQTVLDDDSGTLDVETSIQLLKGRLAEIGILTARTFSTRVRLANGS